MTPAMTSAQWQRAKEMFAAASDLVPAARAQYVASIAADDEVVMREVLSLLATPEIAALEGPAVELVREWWDEQLGVEPDIDPWVGKRIGAYCIEALIGSGGMGDVYDATRADEAYQQRVAIKILRASRATRAMVRRFKAERQILAKLEHRNIAKLLDGGTTEHGVPYFAMERVVGRPIDLYCAENKLGIEARLRLFLQVCAAVDHAHRHLVLHRDIKPGNILVTVDGSVKLLDFGIAKLMRLDEDLTGSGASPEGTQTLMPILTPAFCSPEQARGEPLTTATDVYSLGAMLYLLLTGRHAHPHRRERSTTWIEALTGEDPSRPSVAAEGLAGLMGKQESHHWQRRLRGDLDSIVMMALRKEPTLRYASAAHLADDVRRHLDHQPVVARGSQFVYAAGRFIRRHRTAMIAAALVMLALVGGVVATTREARIARAEKARAEQRFSDVRALANALIVDVYAAIRSLPGATAARKQVAEHAQVYLEKLVGESSADPALLVELAGAYRSLAATQGDNTSSNLGDTSSALANYQRAVTLLEAALAAQPDSIDTRLLLARTHLDVATAWWSAVRKDEAAGSHRDAMALLEPLAITHPQKDSVQLALADALQFQSMLHTFASELPQALSLLLTADAIVRRIARAHPDSSELEDKVALSDKRIGAIQIRLGRLTDALGHYRAAQVVEERRLASEPLSTEWRHAVAHTHSDIGLVLQRQNDWRGALESLRRAEEVRAALVATDPQDVRARERLALTVVKIANVQTAQQDLAGALVSLQRALDMRLSLAARTPNDERTQFDLAATQGLLGVVHARLAESSSARERRNHCDLAIKWLELALPTWRRLHAEGKVLDGGKDIAEFELAVASCELQPS